jgi:ribA/ribD-fused uncharacterized protein
MNIPENAVPIWDERHTLANFASAPIAIRGGRDTFSSSEQLYQFTKFLPSLVDIREEILAAQSPTEAKMLVKRYRGEVRPDWAERRFRIMEGVIRLKLRQNPLILQELLSTGDRFIYEDADQYASSNPSSSEVTELRRWGIYKGKGENWMGELLMKLRAEYKETGKV